MKIWLATDLDDTWVKTERKLGIGTFKNVVKDGTGFQKTFFSAKDLSLLSAFKAGGIHVIPVTGRSAKSCDAWELNEEKFWVGGGIFSHGAEMRCPMGNTVIEWDILVRNIVLKNKPIEAWKTALEKTFTFESLKIVDLVVGNSAFGVVIKAKSEAAEIELSGFKETLETLAHGLNLDYFHQKHHFTVIMHGISKRAALTFWRNKFSSEIDVWLGAGDAKKDGEFMASCDWIITPSGSEWSTDKG